jgi:hypothetical protein
MNFTIVSKYGHLLAGALTLLIAFLALSDVLFSQQPVLVGANSSGSLFYWTTWWPRHAIANDYDLVFNSYTLFPIESNLLPLLSPLSTTIHYPFSLIFGERIAFNLLVPIYLSLNAFSVYLLLNHHLNSRLLPFFGGLIVAFNPVMLAFAEAGQIALLAFFPLVMWLLLFERYLTEPNIPKTLLLAAALYAVVLTSMQFWNLIVTLLIPYAALRVWQAGASEAHLRDGLLLVLIVAALTFIFPVPALLHSTYELKYRVIENWVGMVIIDARIWSPFAIGGLILGAAAMFSPWDALPMRRAWIAIAALNLIGYLNPDLGPLDALAALLNVPNAPRFSNEMIYLLPLILVGVLIILQTAEFYLPKIEESIALGLVALLALLLVAGWWRSLPATVVPDYDFYETLAQEPEDYLIAEIPIGIDSIAHQQTAASRYPAMGFPEFAGVHLMNIPTHHKRIIGGQSAYHSPQDLTPYEENPLLRLLMFQPSELPLLDQARFMQNEVRRIRLGYVVIHRDAVSSEFVGGLRGWLAWTRSFCLVAEDGPVEFWRASWHPAGCPAFVMDMSADYDFLAMGDNWYPAEGPNLRWAGPGETSTLTLWVQPLTEHRLSIETSAPVPQQVTVFVNGDSLGSYDISTEGGSFNLTVPAQTVGRQGLLMIELRHQQAENIEGRALTALYNHITLEVSHED